MSAATDLDRTVLLQVERAVERLSDRFDDLEESGDEITQSQLAGLQAQVDRLGNQVDTLIRIVRQLLTD